MSDDKTTIAADPNPNLSQARRHFPQIRLGTKIGKFLGRHQAKNEKQQQDTVPNAAELQQQQQQQQLPNQQNDAEDGGAGEGPSVQNGQQMLTEQQPMHSNSGDQISAEGTEAAAQEQRKSDIAEGEEAEKEKGANTRGPNSAPEARQKLGKRRTSIVHPMESDQQQREQMPSAKRPATSARPPNASRFGPSSPTPWIYLQMADRSFRRTTVAQLQAENQLQQQDGQNVTVPSANGQMLAPEFASVKSALIVQNAFHRFALIVQGFMAGLTFGHALFAFFIADLHFLQNNVWMAVWVHAFFHFCLAIGVVEALDRFEFGIPLLRSLCSLPSVGIFACFFAFLASIWSAQIEQLLAEQTVEKNSANKWDAKVLFTVWQLFTAVRAVCALFAWLTMAIRPTANATRETLAKMLPSNASTAVPS